MERAARPELVDALEKSDATRAEETRDVLRVAGVPTAALEETYAEVRVITPLMREWRAFDDIVEQNVETSDAKSLVKAERFAAWLPGYFERVASTLAGEARFATRAFGEEGGALVAHAWIALSEKTKRSFSARMASGRVASFVSVSSAAGEGAARAARGVAGAAGARASPAPRSSRRSRPSTRFARGTASSRGNSSRRTSGRCCWRSKTASRGTSRGSCGTRWRRSRAPPRRSRRRSRDARRSPPASRRPRCSTRWTPRSRDSPRGSRHSSTRNSGRRF